MTRLRPLPLPGEGGRAGRPARYEEVAVRIELYGDEIESIREFDPLTGEVVTRRDEVVIFPASHYVTPAEQMKAAIQRIETELEERVRALEERGSLLEAQRLRQRTGFDVEMMRRRAPAPASRTTRGT